MREIMASRVIAVAALLVACGSAPPASGTTTSDAGGAADAAVLPKADAEAGPKPSSLPECGVQRVVHVVAGNGGFAWFSQVWPVPAVIQAFDPTYAYDDPSKALLAPGSTSAHPLYGRIVEDRTVVLDGTGSRPMPTAFVAGFNETHTTTPNLTQFGGDDVIAVAAAMQETALHPAETVIALRPPVAYVASGAQPVAFAAADPGSAIAALEQANLVSTSTGQDLAPSAATISTWFDTSNAPATLLAFADDLDFAANAFRDNVASTVVLGAFRDDPNKAFDDLPSLTYRADSIARILHHFYETLAASDEPACSHDGHVLSLAENVVLVVTGDTLKDPFERNGWPDGTPGAANVIFVRSNGWLVPGWFGAMTPPYSETGFDPATGALSPDATLAEDQNAAALGLLYAITRGNATVVAGVSGAPYEGAVNP